MDEVESLMHNRSVGLFPHLTERQRRLSAAADARALGRGGVSRVARATGLSRITIRRGLSELGSEELAVVGYLRKVEAYDAIEQVGSARQFPDCIHQDRALPGEKDFVIVRE